MESETEAKGKGRARLDVLKSARQHPVTVRQIQRIGEFETYNQAAVWANKKRNQGLLTHVGTIPNECGTGRSIDVYCNGWQPKRDNLRHEVKGTDFCLLYPQATFRRGYHVGDLRPDIEMELDGHLYLIEIDCGTMTKAKVLKRWQRYKKRDDITVFIIAVGNPLRGIESDERLKELIRWSGSMYGIACFVRFEDIIADPYGPVLWDAEEKRFRALKKPQQTNEETEVLL